MRQLITLLLALVLASSTAFAQLGGALVINEVVASNDSLGFQEPDGGFGDWAELFNKSNNQISLDGVSLSDDFAELNKWTFPSGIVMEPGSYLIVWLDNDLDQQGIHASFKLKKEGESLIISQGGALVDSMSFGPQETNISMARIPNGTGPFQSRTTTPLANNNSSTSDAPTAKVTTLSCFPNPAGYILNIQLGTTLLTSDKYSIIDLNGAIIEHGILEIQGQQAQLNVAHLAKGQYLVVVGNNEALANFQRL